MRAGAAELGIRLTAVDIEWDAKVENYSRPETSTDLGTIWLFAPGPEAHHYLYSLAHSSQAGDGGNNFAWFQTRPWTSCWSNVREESDGRRRVLQVGAIRDLDRTVRFHPSSFRSAVEAEFTSTRLSLVTSGP